MADIIGQRGTLGITQGLRATDFSKEILELDPSATPLTVLTSRIGSIPAINPEYKWAESDLEVRSDTSSTAGTGTTLTVANPNRWAEHQTWKVSRTGELIRVLSVVGTSVEVVRGIAAAAVALNGTDELIKVGVAKPEGDDISPARSRNPTIATNYLEIFREPYSITETNRIAATFTQPADWAYAGKHAAIEHKRDIERSFWHSKPSENTSGPQARRTTGGALYYISTNVIPVGGAMTEAAFFAGLRGPFRYGMGKTLTLFGSMLFADVLNGYPKSKVEVVQGDGNQPTYGLNVRRFMSPHGNLNLVTAVDLEGATFGGYGVVLNMENIRKRHLQTERGSRDTHIVENRQGPGVDGRTDELVSEVGLQFGLEKTHAVYTGVTG